MQVNNQQAANLLKQNTGVDVTREAKVADRLVNAELKNDSRTRTTEQSKAEPTTANNRFQGITFGEPRPDQRIEINLPFDPSDLFNPGSEVNTGGTQKTGDADGTEPTENAGSLLAGVDLFDFDSLDDAIAKGQEMISNGEGSAQLFGELQLLLQSQMQMVSLISNQQKVQHDTAMAAINNIR